MPRPLQSALPCLDDVDDSSVRRAVLGILGGLIRLDARARTPAGEVNAHLGGSPLGSLDLAEATSFLGRVLSSARARWG